MDEALQTWLENIHSCLQVNVYGQKVSGRRKAQYIAQQVVNVVHNKAKIVEFNFYPPTADQLHHYAQVLLIWRTLTSAKTNFK